MVALYQVNISDTAQCEAQSFFIANCFSDGRALLIVFPRLLHPAQAAGMVTTVLTTLSGNGLSGPVSAAFDGERILITNLGNSVSLCGKPRTSLRSGRFQPARALVPLEPAVTA